MRTRKGNALGVSGAAILVVALTTPTAAAAPTRWTGSDSYVVAHDCGIVEATTVTVTELAYFENGSWVRSRIHFVFDGVFTGPTGETYAATSHQNATFTPTTGAVSGQGSFLRGAGGVIVMDAGRLVFDLGTGQTLLASAQVMRWDDPDAFAALEAALCERLG